MVKVEVKEEVKVEELEWLPALYPTPPPAQLSPTPAPVRALDPNDFPALPLDYWTNEESAAEYDRTWENTRRRVLSLTPLPERQVLDNLNVDWDAILRALEVVGESAIGLTVGQLFE